MKTLEEKQRELDRLEIEALLSGNVSQTRHKEFQTQLKKVVTDDLNGILERISKGVTNIEQDIKQAKKALLKLQKRKKEL